MKRTRLTAGVILVSASFFTALVIAVVAAPPTRSETVTADDALKDLMEGNARFSKGEATSPRRSPADFRAVSESQSHIAVARVGSDTPMHLPLVTTATSGGIAESSNRVASRPSRQLGQGQSRATGHQLNF